MSIKNTAADIKKQDSLPQLHEIRSAVSEKWINRRKDGLPGVAGIASPAFQLKESGSGAG